MTPEEIAESRRHVARMGTAELAQIFGKGAEAWSPEAWAILEEEVARRERVARVSRLQTAGASTADGGAPAKRRFGVLGGALLAFLGLVGVGYCAIIVKSPTALPACDSADAESAVRDAIENSVGSRLVNHRLLALRRQSEVSYHEAKLERTCKAKAILNSGEIAIKYRLYKLSATEATFFVEVTEQ
jgi:hypothetical protein